MVSHPVGSIGFHTDSLIIVSMQYPFRNEQVTLPLSVISFRSSFNVAK